jgi:hypothetical protein
MGDAARVRFGREIHARRKELGLTRDAVAALGGPSAVTQMRVENAEGSIPHVRTRNKFDAPMQWTVGSAARLWAGGEPSHEDVGPSGGSRDSVTSWPPLAPFPVDIRMTEDELTGLLVAVRRLRNARRSAKSSVPQEITHLIDAIDRSATGLAQEWLRGRCGSGPSDQSIVHQIFSPSGFVRI